MALNIGMLLIMAALAAASYQFVQELRALGQSTRARRRKRYLGAAVAAIVLLSSFVPSLWPLPGVHAIAHATLVAAAVVVPLLVFFILRRRWRSKTVRYAPTRVAERHTEPSHTIRTAEDRSNDDRPAGDQPTDEVRTFVEHTHHKPEPAIAYPREAIDDDSLDAMQRMDDLVETHLLDETLDASQFIEQHANALDTALEVDDPSPDQHIGPGDVRVPVDTDRTALQVMSLQHDVVVLRKENTRHKKLILAQKAALDTERRAHKRTRDIAERAVQSLEESRLREATLRKLARRERVARFKMREAYDDLKSRLQPQAEFEEID